MSEKDWFVVAAVLLVLLSAGSFAMMGLGGFGIFGGWGGMMRNWGYGTGLGIGWLFPLACFAVLASLGWLFFKAARGRFPGECFGHDARSVLRMRLAKGEISKKEFKELSEVVERGDE